MKTNLFDQTDGKILHVAAEPCFEKRFKNIFGKNYITADLYNPDSMVKMDVTDIRYPDESFDIIICNHVLEHVPDDIKAMGEFYRVLKKNGWAVLLVPIADMDKTYEDFSITTETGRLKAFGQGDHVRKYGRDYIDRLKFVGFNVTVIKRGELASEEEINRMCLNENSEIWGFAGTEIFYCRK
jgi:SAM-dependent methyltransferase